LQRTLEPRRAAEHPTYIFHDHAPDQTSFADAVLNGLSSPQKSIPCRFLYDEAGSKLFERICEQPEYYPTRTEMLILERNARTIADLVGPGAQLVELGSGAGRKVRLLLDAMEAPSAYVSVDISREALVTAAYSLANEGRDITIHAVWADYSAPFDLPVSGNGRVVGFFPGSTIGNLEREEAREFLAVWARRLGPGSDMIVGVDLIKPVDVLERAYDDAAGVTAAFSLNILRRANRELGADFDVASFRHEARYSTWNRAVEIHLVSLRDQVVTVVGREFQFAEGEKLHIENSHKYDLESFAELARSAGFDWHGAWTDSQQLFSVHYLKTRSPPS
jgi:dimethylhistidine N-methyltransferase